MIPLSELSVQICRWYYICKAKLYLRSLHSIITTRDEGIKEIVRLRLEIMNLRSEMEHNPCYDVLERINILSDVSSKIKDGLNISKDVIKIYYKFPGDDHITKFERSI